MASFGALRNIVKDLRGEGGWVSRESRATSGFRKEVAEKLASNSMAQSGDQLGLFGGFSANETVKPGERFGKLRQQVLESRKSAGGVQGAADLQGALPGVNGNNNIRWSPEGWGHNNQGGSPLKPKILENLEASRAARAGSGFKGGSVGTTAVKAGPFHSVGYKSEGFFKDMGRGIENHFGKGNWMNPIMMNAGGGAIVGGVMGGMSSVASAFDPDHFQSNGMVKSAIKGGLAGAALGALHVGVQGAHSMTQVVQPGNQFGHAIAGALPAWTQGWSKSMAVSGALAMGVVGSNNIRTRASNPIK